MEEKKGPSQDSSPVPVSHPGASEDHTAALATRERQVFYDDARAALIIDAYTEGKSLREIGETPGMPAYGTLLKWLKTKDAFRHRMRAAHEVRGMHFFDQALHAGTSAEDKDDVGRARLEFDTYKWAAEISDPATFGKSVKVSGDQNAPIRIVVSTGVPEPKEVVTLDAQGMIVRPPQPELPADPVVAILPLPEDHHDQITEGDLT